MQKRHSTLDHRLPRPSARAQTCTHVHSGLRTCTAGHPHSQSKRAHAGIGTASRMCTLLFGTACTPALGPCRPAQGPALGRGAALPLVRLPATGLPGLAHDQLPAPQSHQEEVNLVLGALALSAVENLAWLLAPPCRLCSCQALHSGYYARTPPCTPPAQIGPCPDALAVVSLIVQPVKCPRHTCSQS